MRWFRLLTGLPPVLLSLLAASSSFAGISAENVIVVVNAESLASRTVANHYIAARGIPTGNVVQLKGVPTDLKISLDDFKSKILGPLLGELNRRRLAPQARVIAYSADFPTTVDVSAHRKGLTDANVKKYQSGSASINGLTFFYRFILADRNEYLNWGSNLYARGRFERHFVNPFAGEPKETFAKADKDLAEGRELEAGQSFAKLFETYPTMPPLALLAAKAYVQADKRDQAVAMLRSAIKSRWWSKEYLTQDESLSTLLDDPQISKVLPLLSSSPIAMQGPVGFAPHRGWTASGHPVRANQGGMPYLLSCALAVVRPNGSTVKQAVEVLTRASSSDRTYPDADFRFAANGDVRAKTRFPNIADALVYIQDAGHQTDVFRSNLPSKPGNVAGLMVGRATVNLNDQPWQLVPGAIAENLTSYGGTFGVNGHTKITEFLHAGAAMSSGAVAEPYSLQFKFPLPIMYGYYAKGMSAIEAFYLSVTSPYQLLIVGDPVCQPFAKPPGDWIDIRQDEQDPSKIVMQLRSLGLRGPQTRTRSVEFYIGGRFVKESPPARSATIDLSEEASGVIEVRAVLIGFDETEPRISFSKYIDLQGPLATPKAGIAKDREGAKIVLAVECENADSVSIAYFGEVLASIQGSGGEITIDASKLGSGPLRLRPIAKFGDKPVLGQPIVVE